MPSPLDGAKNMTARFEVLAGLPPYGPLPLQFSATGQGTHREGYVVRFRPESSESWVGNFQPGVGTLEGVFQHPDGTHLFVIAAGAAYVIDPDTRVLSSHFGFNLCEAIEVPELHELVFTNGLWFEGFAAQFTWRSRRVSWDGVRSLQRTGTILQGEAYTPLGDFWRPFSLDLATGRCQGGAYLEHPEGAV